MNLFKSLKIQPASILTTFSLFTICWRSWVGKGSVEDGIDFRIWSVLGVLELLKCNDFVIGHVWIVIPFVVERISQTKVWSWILSATVHHLRHLIGEGNGFGV